MTPPVFLAVAALGLAASLMAQTPVHLMSPEIRNTFTCLTVSEEVERAEAIHSADFGIHGCGLEAERAIREDRNVMVFSDVNPLAPAAPFCPVRVETIEGLEITPELPQPANPALEEPPVPVSHGVLIVGRSTRSTAITAAPVPEPTISLLLALGAMRLIRRRR